MKSSITNVHIITEEEKREISRWKYPSPYDIYNLPSYSEMKSACSGFCNPEKSNNYYTYYINNTLAGYTNFSEKSDSVMLGIGLANDFCGKGYGQLIITEACQLCNQLFPGKAITLQVRSWNIRAIKCYEKSGFVATGQPYTLTTPLGEGEFVRMVKNNAVKDNQQNFLRYAESFAVNKQINIAVCGSFGNHSQTKYSDIDLVFHCSNLQTIKDFIYNYSLPVYISRTVNPAGILIVIYSDGVALDLEISDSSENNPGLIYLRSAEKNYKRIDLIDEFCNISSAEYHNARLFHRSITKYLSGKTDSAISILNEISAYLTGSPSATENFKQSFAFMLNKYIDKHSLPSAYSDLLWKLYSDLK